MQAPPALLLCFLTGLGVGKGAEEQESVALGRS